MTSPSFPDLDLLGLTPRQRAWIYLLLVVHGMVFTSLLAAEVSLPKWYVVVAGVAQSLGHVLARRNVEK